MGQQSGGNERFKEWRQGEQLSADFINRVASAVMRSSTMARGSDMIANSSGVFPRPTKSTSSTTAGGGVPIIRFQLVNVDCAICIALGTVLSRPVGATEVTGEAGGQVTLYDFAGCYFNAPSADLTGKQGFAAFLNGGAGDCGVEPIDTGRWEVFALCCAEESCP